MTTTLKWWSLVEAPKLKLWHASTKQLGGELKRITTLAYVRRVDILTPGTRKDAFTSLVEELATPADVDSAGLDDPVPENINIFRVQELMEAEYKRVVEEFQD